ncbi:MULTISPECIES: DUF11 domain-containing protein [Deinococcus]|uniref:DUF11 domain-containing protein n=1 Tax=Deinococcus TaxID=1298 RepID=UPI0012D338A7|nr:MULTISPECIES: DUF11 domain-containing protein [Deinococcus]
MFSPIPRVLLLSLSLLLSGGVAAAGCAEPGRDGPVYVANSYYPGVGTASAGDRTVTVGALRTGAGTTPIAAGDQVLLIQMQDADINPAGGPLTNTSVTTYGDGSTGRGYTALNNTGRYEFAVVTAVSGTAITLRDSLQYSYRTAPAGTSARRSFQVLRIPQLSSVTLTSPVTPPVWNGETGGVVVLDAAGTLNLNGQTISADAAGYRGGGSFTGGSLTGQGVSDYANTYVTTASRGAMKGEGIAGTPTLVRGTTVTNGYSGVAAGLPTGDLGYPNAFVVARGAPGNAGGGGTQHNAGGGGGGGVGLGGRGGYSYGTYATTNSGTCRTLTSGSTTYYSCGGDGSRDVGGLGGAGITPDATRLIMGGGGGAGDSNNSADNATTEQNSGGAGGGAIFIRAQALTGSGTISANGQAGQPAGRDAAGGGGAGGVVALALGAGAVNATVQVRGGAGANSGLPLRGNETQGTGGGGGGGAVLLATGVTVSAPDVTGGTAGVNTPVTGVSNTYGAVAGDGGQGRLVYENAQAPLPGQCVPRLTVEKTTSTPTRFVSSSGATYTITVRNDAGRATARNVTLRDPALPAAFTYASTGPVVLSGGATRAASSDPTAGQSSPAWSTFTLPGGSDVTLTFDVTLSSPAPGVYQNAAATQYLDPSRTAAADTAQITSNPAASTAEDVTVYALPRVTLDKWVRNVTRAGAFQKVGGGQPGDILEYCINVTNAGGYVANNITVTDALPANTLALLNGYGQGLGVRAAATPVSGADRTSPAGTNLTASADTDAGSLDAARLQYVTTLPVGAQGSVCFQASIR